MIRTASRVLLALAVVLTAACDEDATSLGSGVDSTVEVRAYVDADGDGAFGSGDLAITGATVTASRGGVTVLQATTDASGLATFANVDPGSYRLALSGDVPAGAVLATASEPVVVAPFEGADIDLEFRYTYFPGTIAGRVFRDDDASGAYEDGADLPAAGIPVELYAGPDTTDDPVATTTTDADGAYLFSGVRPGSYTVVVRPLPSMEVAGGTVRSVTVGAEATEVEDFLFEGSLVIDIAQARAAAEGRSVTVEGVVTFRASWDSRAYAVQDGTGGIAVFDSGRPDLELGDVVRLTGTRSAFNGELQISPVASVEVIGSAALPEPRSVSAADVNAGLFQGELATGGGRVEAVTLVNSFGSHVVTIRDASGLLSVFVDNRTGVTADDWEVGAVYAVTGILGANGDDFQLEVRSADDVEAGGAAVPIGEARGRVGEAVAIEGVVSWQPDFSSSSYFVQDGTGGIAVFHSGAPDLQRGDRVRLEGTIGAFRGETQISDITRIQVLGHDAVPDPRAVTGAQVNAGAFQGELVTVTATVVGVTADGFDNQTVTVRDAAGTELVAYGDSRTGLASDDWTVGSTVRVTGVLGTDDRNTPAPRIEVRGPEDVVVVEEGSVSIAEARAMLGEVVTIRGVVSRQVPWDSRVYYLQDGSGGLSTFHAGGPEGLAPGDSVRLTGEIGAFRGEVQISGIDSVVVATGGPAPAPVDATAAQINAGLFQGVLARVSGTVTSVEVINSFGTQQVTVLDEAGDEVLVLVDNRTGLTEESWTVGETVTVVAPVGFFDGNEPGPQLEVTRAEDVTFGS